MAPFSPRSGARKVGETIGVLGLLALAIPAALQALREFSGAPISPDLEIKLTAFLVAFGGVVLRAGQHWWVYRRRR
jgi:hypothetical protein